MYVIFCLKYHDIYFLFSLLSMEYIITLILLKKLIKAKHVEWWCVYMSSIHTLLTRNNFLSCFIVVIKWYQILSICNFYQSIFMIWHLKSPQACSFSPFLHYYWDVESSLIALPLSIFNKLCLYSLYSARRRICVKRLLITLELLLLP